MKKYLIILRDKNYGPLKAISVAMGADDDTLVSMITSYIQNEEKNCFNVEIWETNNAKLAFTYNYNENMDEWEFIKDVHMRMW